MIRNCRHTMPAGAKCLSPAMRNSAYCYTHAPLHQYPRGPRPTKKSLQIPKPEDSQSLLAGLKRIMDAILTEEIDPRRAGQLLYGMQIASDSLRNARKRHRAKPMASTAFSSTAAPNQQPGGHSIARPNLKYDKG